MILMSNYSDYELQIDTLNTYLDPIIGQYNNTLASSIFKKRFIRFLREDTSLIWIIFGTIGNLLTLLVLCKQRMRKHSTFTYLTILSLCDTLVLYFGLFRDYLVYKYKIDVDGDFLCKFHVFFFYFVLHMASWLLVAVNIDRLVAASFLGFSKKWCTPRVAMIVSFCLALVFIIINSHFLFFVNSSLISNHYYLNFSREFLSGSNLNKQNITISYSNSSLGLINDNKLVSGAITFTKIHATPDMLQVLEYPSVNPFVYSKCLIKNDWPKYNYFFVNIFTWIDAGAQVIVPFIIMVICNVNIIYKVLLTKSKSNGKNSKRLRKIKGMCIMIISVSIIFFVLEMPVLVFLCLMQGKFENSLTIDMLWTIVNLMMYTNHVINFFSYCMTGTQFRRELLYLICIDLRLLKIFPKWFTDSYSSLLYSHKTKNTSFRYKTVNSSRKCKMASKMHFKEKETMGFEELENNFIEIEQEPFSVYLSQNISKAEGDDPIKHVNFEELDLTINVKTPSDQLKSSSLTSLIYKKKNLLLNKKPTNDIEMVENICRNYDKASDFNLNSNLTSSGIRKDEIQKSNKFNTTKQVKKRSSLKREIRKKTNLNSSTSNLRGSFDSPYRSKKKIFLV